MTANEIKFIVDADRPTSSRATGHVPVADIVDAVNAIPNEAARRMAIAALRVHAVVKRDEDVDAPIGWLTRRGGYLSVTNE